MKSFGQVDELRLDNGFVALFQRIPGETIAAQLRVNQGGLHE